MIGFPVLVMVISWISLFAGADLNGAARANELRGTAENKHLCMVGDCAMKLQRVWGMRGEVNWAVFTESSNQGRRDVSVGGENE